MTGGGSGLGKAMATVLVECGAHVVVADRNQERLDLVHEELAASGSVEVERVDVTDETAVDVLVDGIVARHGRIDAVFANAGIAAVPGPGRFRRPARHLRHAGLGRVVPSQPLRRRIHHAGRSTGT